MAPPDRHLEGLSLPGEPALTRLANVPGFGKAWGRLPATANLRQQMVAHQADLALIYAADRSVDCMPSSDDSKYRSFSSEASQKEEQRNQIALLEKQAALTQTWLKMGSRLEPIWVGMSVPERERVLLRAIDDWEEERFKWVWMLFSDEITLDLAAGDGSGLADLIRKFIFKDPKHPPKELQTFPHRKWDSMLGIDGRNTPSIPRSRGARGFQSAMVTQRVRYICFVLQNILADLAGVRRPPDWSEERTPLSPRELEEQYQNFVMTMITQAGSESRAKAAMKGMSINGPSDFAAYYDKIMFHGNAAATSWVEQRYRIWRSEKSNKERPRVQGYLKAGEYYIAWGNPVAVEEDIVSTAGEFAEFCKTKHKRVVFMSINSTLEKGLSDGKIGGVHWNSINCIREDVMHPKHVELSRKDVKKNRLSAWRSGVRIDEVVIKGPTFLPPPELKLEIENGLQRWLDKRKGTQIASSSLLPWIDSRNRRYFVAKQQLSLLLHYAGQFRNKFELEPEPLFVSYPAHGFGPMGIFSLMRKLRT
ncbi:hypothetical protein P7C70_g3424, partial [Phenoliferia sp. Uapishka_3]